MSPRSTYILRNQYLKSSRLRETRKCFKARLLKPRSQRIHVDASICNAFVHRHGFISPYESGDNDSSDEIQLIFLSSPLATDALRCIALNTHRWQLELNAWDAVNLIYHLIGPCWLSACDRLVRNRSEGESSSSAWRYTASTRCLGSDNATLPNFLCDMICNAELSASPSSQQLLTTWRFVQPKTITIPW